MRGSGLARMAVEFHDASVLARTALEFPRTFLQLNWDRKWRRSLEGPAPLWPQQPWGCARADRGLAWVLGGDEEFTQRPTSRHSQVRTGSACLGQKGP